MLIFDTATRVIFDFHFYKLFNNYDCGRHTSEELYIEKPKPTCHITRQASINARASVLSTATFPFGTESSVIFKDHDLILIFKINCLGEIIS